MLFKEEEMETAFSLRNLPRRVPGPDSGAGGCLMLLGVMVSIQASGDGHIQADGLSNPSFFGILHQ